MKPIQVAIAIGIAILLPMLAEMTARFWAEPPKYESFYGYYPDQQPKNPEERQKAESQAKRKQANWEEAQARFNLQVFYVAFPLGVLEVLAGFFLRRRVTMAAGLLFGGLSTIGCGSFSSWETLPGWARYVSLLFVLLLLGALALRLDRSSNSSAAESAQSP